MGLFNPHTLIASLIWGTVGIAFVMYGRKAGEIFPALAGLGMVAASYLCPTALAMTLVSVGLIAALVILQKLGYW
jgi:hypothetical protein